LGGFAFAQRGHDCHLHNHYNMTVTVGEELCTWSTYRGGIAGGCIMVNRDTWDKVGGYKVLGVYSGDDAALVHDIEELQQSFVLTKTLVVEHPISLPEEQQYNAWKIQQVNTCRETNFKVSSNIEQQATVITNEMEKLW
jgi:hypothetical protein